MSEDGNTRTSSILARPLADAFADEVANLMGVHVVADALERDRAIRICEEVIFHMLIRLNNMHAAGFADPVADTDVLYFLGPRLFSPMTRALKDDTQLTLRRMAVLVVDACFERVKGEFLDTPDIPCMIAVAAGLTRVLANDYPRMVCSLLPGLCNDRGVHRYLQ